MTEKYYDKIYSSNAKTTKPMLRELMHEAINLLGKRKRKRKKNLFNNRFGITNGSSVSAHDSMAAVLVFTIFQLSIMHSVCPPNFA